MYSWAKIFWLVRLFSIIHTSFSFGITRVTTQRKAKSFWSSESKLYLLQNRASPVLQNQTEPIEVSKHQNYRQIYKISDSFISMEKLATRLSSCGVENFYFVNDNDETDQFEPIMNGDETLLQEVDYDNIRKDPYVHVKTLVWKGIFLKTSTKTQSSSYSFQEEKKSNDMENKTFTNEDFHFYFVTALRVEDKVDMKRLRTIIKDEFKRKGTLILQMANRDEAEKITGFSSGSMPPGWHSVPFKLYIDDYIIESFNKTNANTSDDDDVREGRGIADNGEQYSNIFMSVGSGCTDYSLHVSLLDTMMSSVYLKEHIQVVDELGIETSTMARSHMRYIASFTRARAIERNKENQKKISAKQKASRVFSVDVKMKQNSENGDQIRPIKLNRKLFHSTAKKKGRVDEVRRMIEILGEDFLSFVQTDNSSAEERFASEFNKNALHYAAWKGDIETVSLLIEECKKYEELKDAVNIISTGEGCYGKTPIFYAITQCRDDMVLHLLALGADLLIVNNKGQSPCSLAPNKLKPETCKLLFQTEESQMKMGGSFRDYRGTHSDERRYGDLDPRFIQLGDVNMDQDIQEELDLFEKFRNISDEDERNALKEKHAVLKYAIPSRTLPVSVRNTDREMRQAIRNRDQEDKWKKKDKESNQESLPRSVRVTTPLWRQEGFIQKQEEKFQRKLEEEKERDDRISNKTRRKEKPQVDQNRIQLLDGTSIDMSLLPILELSNALSSESQGDQVTYEIVDDEAGTQALDFAIEETLALVQDFGGNALNKNNAIATSWGLDCEWRPSRMSGENNPVATLQLSTGSRSFIVDVQLLLQGGIVDSSASLTSIEKALSESLSKLFSNKCICIIGFGIGQDLSKLAASFPHVPCFHLFNSVVDLYALSRLAYPDRPKTNMSSLQKVVAIFFRKSLDKTEQCSEWHERPLRESQCQYASLDAAVLPTLFDKMLSSSEIVIRDNDRFLTKNGGALSSYRFTFLHDEGECSYDIQMGTLKTNYMDLKFARQMWPTLKRAAPSLPEKRPSYVREQDPKKSAPKVKNDAPKKDKKKREDRVKRNAIELTTLAAALHDLPTPGSSMGYTKESCIENIVKKEVIDALPENSYLRYNRRGGMIEIGNCWLLFVNFGVGRIHHKYRNEFIDNGEKMTFTINPSRYEDGELLQNLLMPEDSDMYRKAVMLFVRGSTRETFLYCGQCTCDSHMINEDTDLVNLVLKMKDFHAMKDTDYMRIVSEN